MAKGLGETQCFLLLHRIKSDYFDLVGVGDSNHDQIRPQADATDAAALGPAPLGPAPW